MQFHFVEVLVQSVSINFTYSSPGLLVGGRVRSILALDESERLKRNEKGYIKKHHHYNNRVRLTAVASKIIRKREFL